MRLPLSRNSSAGQCNSERNDVHFSFRCRTDGSVTDAVLVGRQDRLQCPSTGSHHRGRQLGWWSFGRLFFSNVAGYQIFLSVFFPLTKWKFLLIRYDWMYLNEYFVIFPAWLFERHAWAQTCSKEWHGSDICGINTVSAVLTREWDWNSQ